MSLGDLGGVTLVGAGKMGLALARGWLDGGLDGISLTLVEPHPSPELEALALAHGANLVAELPEASGSIVVLAVKPQAIGPVLEALAPRLAPEALVLSIAAGISLERLTDSLGTRRVVRTMPNTPAQIGKGVTGAVAADGVDAAARDAAERLLAAAGPVLWFDDEAAIDAVTAVSGSGPAYVFHLVEALAAAGEAEGLAPEIAMALARQTVIGAAALMEADPLPASRLRENVTSPNGTTAAALVVLMEEDGLGALMARAVRAARKRSEELGRPG